MLCNFRDTRSGRRGVAFLYFSLQTVHSVRLITTIAMKRLSIVTGVNTQEYTIVGPVRHY